MTLTDERFDAELKKLTAEHPGIVRKSRGLRRAAAQRARKVRRSIFRSVARGWARVRGTLGSLLGLATVTTAVFLGWGLIPGLFALAVVLFTAEWLLK